MISGWLQLDLIILRKVIKHDILVLNIVELILAMNKIKQAKEFKLLTAS